MFPCAERRCCGVSSCQGCCDERSHACSVAIYGCVPCRRRGVVSDVAIGNMELTARSVPHDWNDWLPAILLAAYATLESAFAAGRRSAFDFMPKPLNQLSCYAEWRRRWKTHVAGRGIKREVR